MSPFETASPSTPMGQFVHGATASNIPAMPMPTGMGLFTDLHDLLEWAKKLSVEWKNLVQGTKQLTIAFSDINSVFARERMLTERQELYTKRLWAEATAADTARIGARARGYEEQRTELDIREYKLGGPWRRIKEEILGAGEAIDIASRRTNLWVKELISFAALAPLSRVPGFGWLNPKEEKGALAPAEPWTSLNFGIHPDTSTYVPPQLSPPTTVPTTTFIPPAQQAPPPVVQPSQQAPPAQPMQPIQALQKEPQIAAAPPVVNVTVNVKDSKELAGAFEEALTRTLTMVRQTEIDSIIARLKVNELGAYA